MCLESQLLEAAYSQGTDSRSRRNKLTAQLGSFNKFTPVNLVLQLCSPKSFPTPGSEKLLLSYIYI